jgi:hypothetical protein
MLVIVMLKPLTDEFDWKHLQTVTGVREEEMSSAIGIEKKAVTLTMGANEDAQVAEALSRVLADTFTLYLKTHNFH